jgi:hypothetical protein
MRDHMMGYPPAAEVSAECPNDYDEFAIFDYGPFPCGLPKRVRAEMRAADQKLFEPVQRTRDFENLPHANPDGSYTPKRPGATFAGITAMGTEPASFAYNRPAPDATEAPRAFAWSTVFIGAGEPVVQTTEHSYEEVMRVTHDEWEALSKHQQGGLNAIAEQIAQRNADERQAQLTTREKGNAWTMQRMQRNGLRDAVRAELAAPDQTLFDRLAQQGVEAFEALQNRVKDEGAPIRMAYVAPYELRPADLARYVTEQKAAKQKPEPTCNAGRCNCTDCADFRALLDILGPNA